MADIVIKGNNVFTGIEDKPFAGFVAVEGNKIAAVEKGTDASAFIGPDTKVYEYGDELIMAGLFDPHLHFAMTGAIPSEYYLCGLDTCTSEQEVLDKVKEFAEEHPDYEIIKGFGYTTGNWDDPTVIPRRFELDEVVPDRPCIMTTFDMHSAWLNTKAIELCGINGPDVKFDELVERDENGLATGFLSESSWLYNAFETFFAQPPEVERILRGRTLATMKKYGITHFSDLSGHTPGRAHDFESMVDLEKQGLLTARGDFAVGLQLDGNYEEQLELQKIFDGCNLLRSTAAKLLSDGVTQIHTGVLLSPYADDPTVIGEPLWPLEGMEKGIIAANAVGLNVRVHAIAEGSVRIALDSFEKSEKINGSKAKGIRNTIEHIETINDADIPRFAELGVVASMQPEHLAADYNDQETRVGIDKWNHGWLWKDIMNAGGHVAFGSDSPVTLPNPFRALYFAVTRNGYDGKPTGSPHTYETQRATVLEGLRNMTIEGAFIAHREDELGTLEVGKLADIAVVDRDLFTCDPNTIIDAEAKLTMVDGKVVYEA